MGIFVQQSGNVMTKSSSNGKNTSVGTNDPELLLLAEKARREDKALKSAITAKKDKEAAELYAINLQNHNTPKKVKVQVSDVYGSPLWHWMLLFGLFFVMIGGALYINGHPWEMVKYPVFLGVILAISAMFNSWLILLVSLGTSPFLAALVKWLNIIT